MRLFISIELPKEVKDYLFELQNKLKKELGGGIKWVSKKNLHQTGKFFGEVKEEKLDELRNKLKNIKFKPFEATLTELDYYTGSKGQITVLWTAIEPESKIIELQQTIDQETMEFSNIEQKFSAHLTLGRVKSVKNEKKFKETIKNTKLDKRKFTIDSFHLIRSVLNKDGPSYKTIESFKN